MWESVNIHPNNLILNSIKKCYPTFCKWNEFVDKEEIIMKMKKKSFFSKPSIWKLYEFLDTDEILFGFESKSSRFEIGILIGKEGIYFPNVGSIKLLKYQVNPNSRIKRRIHFQYRPEEEFYNYISLEWNPGQVKIIFMDLIDVNSSEYNIYLGNPTKIEFVEKFQKEVVDNLSFDGDSWISQYEIKQEEDSFDNLLLELPCFKNSVFEFSRSSDFKEYVTHYQSKIMVVEKEYGQNFIHFFVKISNHLNVLENGLNIRGNNLVNSIKERKSQNVSIIKEILSLDTGGFIDDFEDRKKMVVEKHSSRSVKEEINEFSEMIEMYDVILTYSFVMVHSLLNNDRIRFYEIYEVFDGLEIFNTNWENKISLQLKSIENKLNLIYREINQMKVQISQELSKLSMITEEVGRNISSELKSVNSSIEFNNLLTGIQTYQMYKINKNTKSLRG